MNIFTSSRSHFQLFKAFTNRQVTQAEPIVVEEIAARARPRISREDHLWLERFEKYIDNNLGKDYLSIPQLAEEFAMSESSLLRRLKRLTGRSPKQFVNSMRLKKAWEMLEKRSFKTVAEIAYAVGFGTSRTFSRAFKQEFGILPSEMKGL